jgi:hypothetical protein
MRYVKVLKENTGMPDEDTAEDMWDLSTPSVYLPL